MDKAEKTGEDRRRQRTTEKTGRREGFCRMPQWPWEKAGEGSGCLFAIYALSAISPRMCCSLCMLAKCVFESAL